MSLQRKVELAVTRGDYEKLLSLIANAERIGRRSFRGIERILQKALEKTGYRFSRGQIHFPDILRAEEAVKKALTLLNGRIVEHVETSKRDAVVIASVRENLYDIGETIASVMATAMGFRVILLGDIEQCEIIGDVMKEAKPHAVVLSGKPGSNSVANYSELMKELGLIQKLKLILPGTPVASGFQGRFGIEISYAVSKKTIKLVEALRSNFGVVA
jgi:methanogenic corrinoid protein MtbC1